MQKLQKHGGIKFVYILVTTVFILVEKSSSAMQTSHSRDGKILILISNDVPELGTFEWWISGLMLDPLFFLILRLNNACSPPVINLQIN